jgi:filamin/ABP280 repeat protein
MAIIDCVPLPTGCRRSIATSSRSTTINSAWPRLGLAPLLLVVQLGLAGCGGDDLLLPSAGQPAKISVVHGNGQTGTVGQRLDQPIVLEVTDPGNRPVEGIEVVFVLPAGATIAPNTVVTGPEGRATVTYTLSTKSGSQVVEARATPVVPSADLTTTFTVTANPEAAVRLELAGGNTQRGEVSTALGDSLAVRAVDRFGNGVEGIEVVWDADGGSVSAESVPTAADGRSVVQRILGDSPGSYRTTAEAELEGSPVTFTATGVAAPSPALVLVTQPSAAASAGVPFAQQPELQLQDPTGAPLAREDVRVTVGIASGGGSLDGTTRANSDASGRVRFSDLSIRGEPGSRTLIFAAEGFSPVSSSPIVIAVGPPSAGHSSASVPNGTPGLVTSISIQLKDEFDTPVEGAAGSITVSVSGANNANLSVTDQGNGSYSAAYSPTASGTDQVDILVNGNRVNGSPFTSNVAPGPASPATTTAQISRSRFLFGFVINVLVTTRDAQGNLLGRGGDLVELDVDTEAHRTLVDNGDGTYSDRFFTTAGESLGITLNGQPIAGSPFHP